MPASWALNIHHIFICSPFAMAKMWDTPKTCKTDILQQVTLKNQATNCQVNGLHKCSRDM